MRKKKLIFILRILVKNFARIACNKTKSNQILVKDEIILNISLALLFFFELHKSILSISKINILQQM
jgi:hypothetical protein